MGSFRRIEDPIHGSIAWIIELSYSNLIEMSSQRIGQIQAGLALIEHASAAPEDELYGPISALAILDLERQRPQT